MRKLIAVFRWCCTLAFLALAPLVVAAPASQDSPLPAGLATQVLPAYGHHSRVALGGSIGKLAWAGVIDREKFAGLYVNVLWAHGSALLGMLALGASQGRSEEELYREALAFNAFWFPDNYLHIALYFKAVRGVEWRDVDARTAMSAAFSSAHGWRANVVRALDARGILPQQDGADCSA